MKTFRITSLLTLTLCVFFVASALADDSPNPATAGACKADVQKFCKDVKPGHGAIWKCLGDNQSQLSAGCQTSIADAKAKMGAKLKTVVEACRFDATKFCKDMKPGDGRIAACLRQHESELTDNCSSVLNTKNPTSATRGGPNTD
jgi:hypothetical protein